MTKDFPITRLVFDEAYWPRVRRDEARVAELAALLSEGRELPPVKIQKHSALVLGGWHTVAAYQKLQRNAVPVEIVNVSDDERLLFAYREDVTAALPYTAADVRSVARRLYQQRSNGSIANVAKLARDIGRAQQTVEVWLKDLIQADQDHREINHSARVLAVHAFTAAELTQRRIAVLVDAAQRTVSRDTETGIETQLTDDRVINAAKSLIALTVTRGSTELERRAAMDWLLEQTNPIALQTARHLRALNHWLDWIVSTHRQLAGMDATGLAGCERSPDESVQQKRAELLRALKTIASLTREIEEKTT